MVGVVIAVVLAAGGWTAARLLSGGGAATPEEAVEAALEAIAQQDPVGVAAVIHPDELPLLADFARRISDRSEDLGITSGGSVPGTSLEFSRLRMDVDELSDSVSRVTITRLRADTALDPADLPEPVRSAFRIPAEREASASEGDTALDGLWVFAVKTGGGWYLSPTMTALDLLIQDEHRYGGGYYDGPGDRSEWTELGDFDDYGFDEVFAPGAGSPEDAVEDLAAAIETTDPAEVLAALPSDSAGPAWVFVDWIENWFASRSYDYDYDYRIDPGEVEVADGPGSSRRVHLPELRVQWSSRGSHDRALELDGFEVVGDADSVGDHPIFSAEATQTPLRRFLAETLGSSPYLVVRQVDGGWKVDPLATAIDMATRAVDQLTPEHLASLFLRTDGTPTSTVDVGSTADVDLDASGYALVEVPTTPGALYTVSVTTDDEPSWTGTSVRSEGSDRALQVWDTTTIPILAESESLRVALGGVTTTATSLEVSVHEVEVTDLAVGEVLAGELDTPWLIVRLEDPGDAQLTMSCPEDVSVDLSYSLADAVSTSAECWFDTSYWPVLDDHLGDAPYVVVRGEPGDRYELAFDSWSAGFENGRDTITVDVDAGGVEVPFELPPGVWEIEVDWPGNADVDAILWIDGLRTDSNFSAFEQPFWLTAEVDEPSSGSVALELYGSIQQATVTLTLFEL